MMDRWGLEGMRSFEQSRLQAKGLELEGGSATEELSRSAESTKPTVRDSKSPEAATSS